MTKGKRNFISLMYRIVTEQIFLKNNKEILELIFSYENILISFRFQFRN